MAAVVVQKYGGTSVGDAEKIRRAAERVAATRREGAAVVVVVSAMGDATDRLIELAESVTAAPDPRELDMLLSTGELVSSALMAMALRDIGEEAVSMSGAQAGIRTDAAHGRASIIGFDPAPVRRALDAGRIVIVAGFQGVTEDSDVTTLGRGGSDTTAVALARRARGGALRGLHRRRRHLHRRPARRARRPQVGADRLRGDAGTRQLRGEDASSVH